MEVIEKRCLLFFIKAPERGKVKSRLAFAVGEEHALEIYKRFVLDLLEMLGQGRHCLRICVYPPDAEAGAASWLGRGFACMPQTGNDLGERMKNAFGRAFSEGFTEALLIGSDVPDLPAAFIQEAFSSLKTHDAVIGPAADGGYYLIGFTNTTFQPDIFSDMEWSTERVHEKTMERLNRKGCAVHTLPTWRDVDTVSDLKDLRERNKRTTFSRSKTISYLSHRSIFI